MGTWTFAMGLVLLGIGLCQHAPGQEPKLPPYDLTMVKRPQVFLSIWPLAHLDDWSPFQSTTQSPKRSSSTLSEAIGPTRRGSPARSAT
jgi:hypothetical protein